MSYLSIEEIKEQYDVISYARDHGINVRRPGDRSKSFIDPGKNKSCVVYYRDHWYDFKTSTGGDVIDLCAILEYGGDTGRAIRALGGTPNRWREKTEDLNNLIALWHRNLRDVDIDYLHSRGITDETINKLLIGFNANRIIIPYFKNGYVCNWIGRTTKKVSKTNPKYLKAKKEGIVQSIPWGMNTLGRTDTLIITEGAFDALSFYQEGYSVLAPMGGHFSKSQLKTVRDAVRSHKHTYLIFDSDEAGSGFTRRLAQDLIQHRITHFSIVVIPTGFKDVSEYYEKNKSLDNLLNSRTIDGLYFLCRGRGRDDLRNFLFRLSRFIDQDEIQEVLPKLTSEHSPDWIKILGKELQKAPPETKVADDILKRYELVYSEEERMHEFDGSRWIYRTDTDIKQYIDRDLGKFAKSALTNSVLATVKTRSNMNIRFNQKHLMNFNNGTLELDTGIFRKPRPSDYFTIKADYDYDPKAPFDKFQDFLIDITNNDGEKIELLQEIFGYAMFPENSLQKCPVLIGEGGNGKSLLLMILEHVYGTESVSKVDVSSLNSEFQRIQLKDSLINIAPDIKADMKGAEDYFKRVIAGDAINGCYKGEDFINFVPHSKFVVSVNKLIQPNDTSFGMERRMLFINFPIKFVPNPKRPNEKKENPKLKDELLKELPGIFNWAYQGYKRLMKNQKFTETAEHQQILEQFRAGINPVYAFCKEYLINKNEFTTSDAYIEYVAMFGGSMSVRGFGMCLAKEISNHFPDWCKGRVGQKQGYRLSTS